MGISIGNYTVREVLMKNRTRVWRHIKLFYDKKSYHVTDKYTPNGALYKIAQNMQFFCSCASYVKNNVHLETEYKT